MKPKDNFKLLDAYFEGKTNIEEEKYLREFLRGYKGADPVFLEAKKLFESLHEVENEVCHLNFDDLFNQTENMILEAQQKAKKFNETFHMVQDLVAHNPKGKLRRFSFFINSTAAAAILVLALLLIFFQTDKPVVYAYINGKPITDKELAIKYSEQAFASLAKPFNKGTRTMKHIEKLNKPAELLTLKN